MNDRCSMDSYVLKLSNVRDEVRGSEVAESRLCECDA